MKEAVFNKLCSEMEVYQNRVTEDLKKIDYLQDVDFLTNNNVVEKLEKFLHSVYNGRLQTERKIVEIPTDTQNGFRSYRWRTPRKIGVGSFLGTIHSYRESIEYFRPEGGGYLFHLIPEFLPLIIDKKKRDVIKDFVDYQLEFAKDFVGLGFEYEKPLKLEIEFPESFVIPEPVNFYLVSGTDRQFSVTYEPFYPHKIILSLSYDRIFEGYNQHMSGVVLVYNRNNECVSSFSLKATASGKYEMRAQNQDHIGRLQIKWVSYPLFAFTNISDIMNLPDFKEKINSFTKVMRKQDELANKLLLKHTKLLVERGMF